MQIATTLDRENDALLGMDVRDDGVSAAIEGGRKHAAG